MNAETLATIKTEIKRFHKVFEQICTLWESGQPHYITISVILQNMSHSSIGTVGYNHTKSVQHLHKCLNILRMIAEYHNSHVESYAYNEVMMLIEGYALSEQYEETYEI